MEFEISIPYQPNISAALRTVILTYVPFDTLNVSASLSNPFPNYTDNDYFGFSKVLA